METTSLDFYINSDFERDPAPHNLDVVVQSPYLSDRVYELQLESYSIPYTCPVFRDGVNNGIEIGFRVFDSVRKYPIEFSVVDIFQTDEIDLNTASERREEVVGFFNNFFTFGRRYYATAFDNERYCVEICSIRYQPASIVTYDGDRIVLSQSEPLNIRLYRRVAGIYELIGNQPETDAFWYINVSVDLSSRFYRRIGFHDKLNRMFRCNVNSFINVSQGPPNAVNLVGATQLLTPLTPSIYHCMVYSGCSEAVPRFRFVNSSVGGVNVATLYSLTHDGAYFPSETVADFEGNINAGNRNPVACILSRRRVYSVFDINNNQVQISSFCETDSNTALARAGGLITSLVNDQFEYTLSISVGAIPVPPAPDVDHVFFDRSTGRDEVVSVNDYVFINGLVCQVLGINRVNAAGNQFLQYSLRMLNIGQPESIGIYNKAGFVPQQMTIQHFYVAGGAGFVQYDGLGLGVARSLNPLNVPSFFSFYNHASYDLISKAALGYSSTVVGDYTSLQFMYVDVSVGSVESKAISNQKNMGNRNIIARIMVPPGTVRGFRLVGEKGHLEGTSVACPSHSLSSLRIILTADDGFPFIIPRHLGVAYKFHLRHESE